MGNKLGKLLLLVGLIMLQACAAQSHLVADELETVTKENLKYYLYYPEHYFDSEETFGLLLFLHGGGESGRALEEIKDTGPPKMLAEGKQFPFLILAPQNSHAKKWWNTEAVIQLLDSVTGMNRVDKNRIYLSGLSRGGSAAWELATQYPDKFAAMAVVCGMTPLPYAHWIDQEMPIWVFHGDQDDVIDVEESDKMVAKLRDMGHDVRYTRYKGVGHNAWDRAYTTDSLYTWLANQKRKH
ncbi:MAG: prolyl oligopeptidase family serine peptidase [Muricauda sp.]|jgi:predicted peptidase|nr:PHB depolymerase family esterase [Allomuricauda sp.]MBO6532089.1 prolyl oligopeptidase family serine peptidase [Allomuricauda sp.]MBO6590530.1 prolyl oligopeptidase family serine peptidase [Allomuricauda sp.]MBO6620158.1 prolyl oligopeptidase family serine peptidase [Allomuricauda sp.]MBO6646051.1 prolyl oligopeptidase family serine peptidase [Allomuricauda sp.]MBO6748494.1 prolyl oligopeptidase family serine peptidase [Allomuricauda sp.]